MSSATYRIEDAVGFANTVITSIPTYIISPDPNIGTFPNTSDANPNVLALPRSPVGTLGPGNINAGDQFGLAVAAGSNKFVVGTPEKDDAGNNAGSVFVYDKGGIANFPFQLTANDAGPDDGFGVSVAVNSGRIVVGAPEWDLNLTNPNFGKVYIYDLDGNLISGITPSSGNANGLFGWSVAVGNDRIVVGSIADNDNGTDSGAVYLYDLNGTFIKKIREPVGVVGRGFGTSVAVGNGRIVVGAPNDQNTSPRDGGAVYIYDIDGNLIRKLTEAASASRYGFSVSVGSGKIVIGAPFETVNGVSFGGKVYVNDINGYPLIDLDVSTGSNLFGISPNDQFGYSVSVNNDIVVIGSPFNDELTFNNTGKWVLVYFEESPTSININTIVYVGNTVDFDQSQIGRSVAIGSGTICVGTPFYVNQGAVFAQDIDEDSNVYWDNILETYKY
jgi:hypothetical protein